MGNAIRSIFYDYPDEGREAYLRWFHDVHLPQVLLRPGYLWAAHYEVVPRAQRPRPPSEAFERSDAPALPWDAGYVILVGGVSTRVFWDPGPTRIEENYDEATQKMLARRIRPVEYVHVVEWGMEGPEGCKRDPTGMPAPVIQMGCFDACGQDEDLGSWYAQERMTLVSRTRGCVGGHKLLASSGVQRHGILYDFLSLELRDSHFQPLEETAWTARIHAYVRHPQGSPFVGRRIWPPV